MDNHHRQNLKHYKMGKRISYLKHLQTKLLSQTMYSTVFVEFIGQELEKLDENWISGDNKQEDEYERQMTFFEDKMLEKSLALNQELVEKINTLKK